VLAVMVLSSLGVVAYLYERPPQVTNLQISAAEPPSPPVKPVLPTPPPPSVAPQPVELDDKIAEQRRAEFAEWTIYDIATKTSKPAYLKLNSIQKTAATRVTAQKKITIDPSLPSDISNPPEGTYEETQDVYDCGEKPESWIAESTYYSKTGEVIHHHKWSDPRYVDGMVKPTDIVPRSIAADARVIVCNKTLNTPLVSKQELTGDMKDLTSLASAANGEGEFYYKLGEFAEQRGGDNVDKNAIMIFKLNTDKLLADVYSESGKPAFGDVKYRTLIRLISFKCTESQFTSRKTEYYDDDRKLVDLAVADPAKPATWTEIVQQSPMALLRRITCGN